MEKKGVKLNARKSLTSGYNAILSYRTNTMNKILRKYSKNMVKHELIVSGKKVDTHTQKYVIYNLKLLINSPEIQFLNNEDGICQLTLPLTIVDLLEEKKEKSHYPGYSLIVEIPINELNGEVIMTEKDTIVEDNSILQFTSSNIKNNQTIRFDLQLANAIYHIKKRLSIKSEYPNLITVKIDDNIVNYFILNIRNIYYQINFVNADFGRVTNETENLMRLIPQSFICRMNGENTNSCLSLYFTLEGADGRDKQKVMTRSHYDSIIPKDCNFLLILQNRYIMDNWLIPNLPSMKNGLNRVEKTTDTEFTIVDTGPVAYFEIIEPKPRMMVKQERIDYCSTEGVYKFRVSDLGLEIDATIVVNVDVKLLYNSRRHKYSYRTYNCPSTIHYSDLYSRPIVLSDDKYGLIFKVLIDPNKMELLKTKEYYTTNFIPNVLEMIQQKQLHIETLLLFFGVIGHVVQLKDITFPYDVHITGNVYI